MPPLLADFIHAGACIPICEKFLTLPEIGEFIGRAAADTENDCDVIHSVRSALGHPFFVGAHKTVSLC